MNPLDNINDISKCVIKEIIDSHREKQAIIKEGKGSSYFLPGIVLDQLFSDADCFLDIMQGKDETLIFEFVFPKDGEDGISLNERIDRHKHFISKKRYVFIEKLIYVMSLYDNGYIYFSEEEESALPVFTTITDRIEFFKNENLNVRIVFVRKPTLFEFVNKFYYANIIPTKALIDFYDNGYKTIDQIRDEEQLRINAESLEIARSSLVEAKEATILANKSQRISILISSIICAVSLIGSYFIASTVPVSIEGEFTNSMDRHLRLIEYNDSILIQLSRNFNDSIDCMNSGLIDNKSK